MTNKKRIFFLAPETKGGPYFVYKELSESLKEKYSQEFDIFFVNSKKDYFKLQFGLFGNIDFLFSVIPFVFRPRSVGQYIYNLHGNYKFERKRNNLGNKLLYFAEKNLLFSNKIMLTSYFLANKLNFKEKFKEKIFILPNFVKLNKNNLRIRRLKNSKKIEMLTISSTKFLEKGMGIIDLGKQISKITNLEINWTIIAGGNQKNKKILEKQFNKISFENNIKINWIDWINKEKLDEYYKKTDIFIYGTRLDTWGCTIMEAMNFGLPVILYNYELWKYIYPNKIITKSVNDKIKNIIENYSEYSKLSIKFIKKFERGEIVNIIYKTITTKY